MTEALTAYPYLTAGLMLSVLCVAGLVLLPHTRKRALLSGLLALPFVLYAFSFTPEYWRPVTLVGTPVGIEDALFVFASGTLAWLAASNLPGRKMIFLTRRRDFIIRYSIFITLGMLTSIIVWAAGIRMMSALYISIVFALVALYRRHRSGWPLAVAGAAAFAVIHIAVTRLTLFITPGYLEQWNHTNLSGFLPLGVPLEEILWALAFGAAWPWFFAYVVNARPVSARETVPLSHPEPVESAQTGQAARVAQEG